MSCMQDLPVPMRILPPCETMQPMTPLVGRHTPACNAGDWWRPGRTAAGAMGMTRA